MLARPLRVFVCSARSTGRGQQGPERKRWSTGELSGDPEGQGRAGGFMRGSVGSKVFGEVLVGGSEESQGGSWCLGWHLWGPNGLCMVLGKGC